MSLVTDRCRSCWYSSSNRAGYDGGVVTCDYILLEAKRRPCEAGDACTVYRKGQRRPNINFSRKEQNDV